MHLNTRVYVYGLCFPGIFCPMAFVRNRQVFFFASAFVPYCLKRMRNGLTASFEVKTPVKKTRTYV